MNFGKAFSYMFDDPEWFDKIIIPILFGLIPIVGWFVLLGYSLRTSKNVAGREPYPLPRCEFGEDLVLGIKYLFYFLPYIGVGLLLGGLMVPFGLMLDRSPDNWLGIAGMIFVGLLLALYGIFVGLISPIIQTNFAVKGTFSSLYDFKDIFGMLGKRTGSWLLVILGTWIAGWIAPLGSVACGIGVVLTSMYAELMVAHLRGQAYTHSQE